MKKRTKKNKDYVKSNINKYCFGTVRVTLVRINSAG